MVSAGPLVGQGRPPGQGQAEQQSHFSHPRACVMPQLLGEVASRGGGAQGLHLDCTGLGSRPPRRTL